MIGSRDTQRQVIGRSSLQYRTWGGIVNPMLMAVPMQAANAFQITQLTNNYNSDYRARIIPLRIEKEANLISLDIKLAVDPNYTADRQKGVDLAWKYEQADVAMGGTGSANWNPEQRTELLQRGKVRNYVGHHQKNVANHPQHQTNPDNIRFLRNEKHLSIGHKGNFRNPTDDPFIDKDAMLKHTNRKRVLRNEFKGIGIAAAIGFATGASIGFIVTLAQNGLSPESFKLAAIEGGKVGLEGMAFGVIGHVASRTIGEMATSAMTGVLANAGMELTENLMKACNMGIVGSVIIVASSIYQFVRLKRAGCSTQECLARVGKQALVSVGSLAVCAVVQVTFGTGPAIVVGIAISAVLLSYSMYKAYQDKALAERIQGYVIEKSYPSIIA
ncbi:hypothetical protein [Bacteroides caecicola]|uniref:hypothetical protein n=1 Tax=Bacteroides caecicola TaxID=1462569 RepID=UPI002012965E|nr:hypothetical protein [Bacteroides caecicola]MCL1626159.1 hypothetical protein [Bacteroides caecicola]